MDGVLIIDKPAGMTSHDVVARVRRILNERRIGHTGTLDPFATGVMVLLVGRATRLAQFLNSDEKEYQALIRFGFATDTGDATGRRLETLPAQKASGLLVHKPGHREIEATLESFKGEILQIPPMYSAKKIGGERLYDLARRGIEVEREAVRVVIHQLEVANEMDVTHGDADDTFDLSIRVVCSAGTYIRTLAESIGERLGTVAHLASLRRTRAGSFTIEDAISLEDLEALAEIGKVETKILTGDAALSEMPFVHLTADEARKALHGMALTVRAGIENKWQDNQAVRMRDEENRLIAIGFYDSAAGSLHPRVVLSPAI